MIFIHSAVTIPSKVPTIKSIVNKEQERHIGKISEKLRNTVTIAATYVALFILKQNLN